MTPPPNRPLFEHVARHPHRQRSPARHDCAGTALSPRLGTQGKAPVMTILVGYASRHGSTQGIAEAIADALRAHGHDVTLAEADAITSLDGFDAVVFGSSVYMGRWLASARDVVTRHAEVLASKPTWLFSSGPTGDQTPTAPEDAERYATQVKARAHRVFAGKLDPGTLGLAERLVTRVVNAPTGDYRPWSEIAGWADEIRRDIEQHPAPEAGR